MTKYRKMEEESKSESKPNSKVADNHVSRKVDNSMESPSQQETIQRASVFFWNAEDYILADEDVFDDGNANRQLRRFVEGLPFRLVTNILIIIDLCFAVADVAGSLKDRDFEGDNVPVRNVVFTTLEVIFSCYFVVEIVLRIVALGWKEYFDAFYNVIDTAVVSVTFIVTIIDVAVESSTIRPFKLLLVLRLLRTVRMIRLITERRNLERGLRQAVSQNKRRYQKDGFDLDLTYVTTRVIAMSFPSSGFMSMYRNPIKEVARFLDTKHENHYKVYNLCSEREYDVAFFHGRVERYSIDDHNVPTLRQMLEFKDSVKSWLDDDPLNVIAVHCKGGKGRTGTMVCIWMIYAGLLPSADDCLTYFGDRRTDLEVGSIFQGVETPSQSRYVRYFEKTLKQWGGSLPLKKNLILRTIKVNQITGVGKGNGSDFSVEISLGRNNVVFVADFGSFRNCQVNYNFQGDTLEVHLLNCPILSEDVRLLFQCSSKNVPKGYENVPFYFWFHTAFIENNKLYLTREDLDNPHKRKTWKTFRKGFSVELSFGNPELVH
ncbi:phosphatidylinositol 3,4,5-trisphosphate 3-phosphatase TPTE2-like [Hetaerina americana]|uniref:phosphatidylinositol 3,4,5-trisphosphate 3-phosphatase TPTE2-like n=1 Tax=Hetaerina americana TaxID=62018 RepID=UPI003A7F45B9